MDFTRILLKMVFNTYKDEVVLSSITDNTFTGLDYNYE
jgi:hypothetical protein